MRRMCQRRMDLSRRKKLLRNKSLFISDEPVKECLTGFFAVGVVAGPGVEGGVLESAGEAEGDGPREGAVCGDCSEIVSGLLGGLAAGEEDDAGEVFGDVGFKNLGGFGANCGGGGLLGIFFAGKDHVAFEDAGAEINVGVF